MIITNNCPTLCVMLSRLDSKKGQNLITWYMDDIQNKNTKYSCEPLHENLDFKLPLYLVLAQLLYLWNWCGSNVCMMMICHVIDHDNNVSVLPCSDNLWASPHQTPTLAAGFCLWFFVRLIQVVSMVGIWHGG